MSDEIKNDDENNNGDTPPPPMDTTMKQSKPPYLGTVSLKRDLDEKDKGRDH